MKPNRGLPLLSAWLVTAALIASSAAASAEKRLPFTVHAEPQQLSDIEFRGRDRKDLRLSDFKGRVVLLNVWATWCPPCRREMPTLDKLQATLGGKHFEVVALSIDRGDEHAVEAFFLETRVKHLNLYIDRGGAAMRKLAIAGLPTTLLIDREGREVWRYAGAAEWDEPEYVEQIRSVIRRIAE